MTINKCLAFTLAVATIVATTCNPFKRKKPPYHPNMIDDINEKKDEQC